MPDAPVSAFLLECFPDPSLPNQSLGRASNGNFVLAEFEVDVMSVENAGNPVQSRISKAQADYSQKGYEVANLESDSKGPGRKKAAKRRTAGPWMADQERSRARRCSCSTSRCLRRRDGDDHAEARCDQQSQHRAFPSVASTLPAAVGEARWKVRALPPCARFCESRRPSAMPGRRGELEKFFRTTVDSPVRQADAQLERAKKAAETFERTLPTVMVMKEIDQPRDAFILKRGEYDKPGGQGCAWPRRPPCRRCQRARR